MNRHRLPLDHIAFQPVHLISQVSHLAFELPRIRLPFLQQFVRLGLTQCATSPAVQGGEG